MASYASFVQKNGPRKGQKYKIKTGKSGLKVRVYASGDTALVPQARQQKPKTTFGQAAQSSYFRTRGQ